jgi:hypothetical protein
MDTRPTQNQSARRTNEGPAKRTKANRVKRRARAEKAEVPIPAAARERTVEQRQRDLVASLLRIAEAQTHALEAREAPVPAAELKAAVDLLERLQRMRAAAGDGAGDPEESGRSLSELRDELFNHLCRIRRERGLDPVVPPELAAGRPLNEPASEPAAQQPPWQ